MDLLPDKKSNLTKLSEITKKDGKLIVFEGLDGSGKTTQIRLLNQYLKECGVKFVNTREPGGTPLAEKLRNLMLRDCMDGYSEMLLAFAARNDHVKNFIKPHLNKGIWVICDRFSDSTRAYQGEGRGVSIDLIETISQEIEKDLKIHKVIFLDISPEIAKNRLKSREIKYDRFDSENISFFYKVKKGFQNAALKRGDCALWIEANLSQEDIFKKIKFELKHLI